MAPAAAGMPTAGAVAVTPSTGPNNFYLRGMISAGGYDGDHRRKVNGNTARGNRSGNSWTGVVSLGSSLRFRRLDPRTPGPGSATPTPASIASANQRRQPLQSAPLPREMEIDNVDSRALDEIHLPDPRWTTLPVHALPALAGPPTGATAATARR